MCFAMAWPCAGPASKVRRISSSSVPCSSSTREVACRFVVETHYSTFCRVSTQYRQAQSCARRYPLVVKSAPQFPSQKVPSKRDQRSTKYYLSHARPLQRRSRCTKTVLPFSRFFANRRVRSKMTGMGNILATVVLAVPLLTWLRGTLLIGTSQLRLARTPSAPRGNAPTPGKSNSLANPIRRGQLR